MRTESRELVEHVLAYIDRYKETDMAGGAPEALEADAGFNRLALEVFAYQFKHIPAYRKYCQARRKSPLTVRSWTEIPPLPIQAFKELTLSCEPVEEAQAVFMTSGTTQADKRGKNYHPTLEVWDASMAPPFKRYVLPDRERMTIFVLSPAEDVNRNSSLSRYLSRSVELFGEPDSRLFFSPERGIDLQEVLAALQRREAEGRPVLLMGATFAFVHLLDACEEQGIHIRLPEGSRLFDTGGLKGQAREVTPEELYAHIERHLGVKREDCVNMYGMTELSSQLYDRHIRSRSLQEKPGHEHEKAGGPWIRTLVLDPDTLKPVADGEPGVLAHFDLANWNSSLAILTEDLGYRTERGLVLLGRIQGSEARGCSIAVDQLMNASRK
ncbi:Acyl-protein synthetase, LuxE [Paenibacillus sp. UNCCL117]|uniref:LuxE/PaaK family acyltransferase n=1 Tax=unclassified Paenibacillus TaxID=185978 RepID=UPI00088F35D4|nr:MULTISPECIES: CoF synthetase [unclassified Paenibacillus]SDD02049.1 Acyl-protein synthetase, LuxE [Paenibacillus sp. cl123]SFW32564.1 Acyl-protein synthetase, LuxE [Paenibacillus sp. UNCCL117]